jgi:hypothetical protein
MLIIDVMVDGKHPPAGEFEEINQTKLRETLIYSVSAWDL